MSLTCFDVITYIDNAAVPLTCFDVITFVGTFSLHMEKENYFIYSYRGIEATQQLPQGTYFFYLWEKAQ